jgi:hypothetical protein
MIIDTMSVFAVSLLCIRLLSIRLLSFALHFFALFDSQQLYEVRQSEGIIVHNIHTRMNRHIGHSVNNHLIFISFFESVIHSKT